MPPFESSQLISANTPPVNTLLGDSSSFPFLELPRELRDIIYYYGLTVRSPLKWHPIENHTFSKYNLSIGLLRVCQQVYREAAPVLYSANELEFQLPKSCKEFRSVASPEYSSLVKSVSLCLSEIDISPNRQTTWTQYLGSEPARSVKHDFPNLKQLCIRVECRSSVTPWKICRSLTPDSTSPPQSTIAKPDSTRLHRFRRGLWRLLWDREGRWDRGNSGTIRLIILREEIRKFRIHLDFLEKYHLPDEDNSNQATPTHAITPGHLSDITHASGFSCLPEDNFPPHFDADLALLSARSPNRIDKFCSRLETGKQTEVKVAVVEVLSLPEGDVGILLPLFPGFVLLENGNARVKIKRHPNMDVFLELTETSAEIKYY